MTEIRTIVCPVDFTPISERNLRMGVELCRRMGARLILHHNLNVRPPGFLSVTWMWSEDHESEAEQRAEEVPTQLQDLFSQIPDGVEYEARVTKGPLEETLLFVSRGLPADLIIMGTHGKSNADHDSLTERIVIQAPCSVLTIGESYRPQEVFDAADHPPMETMRFLIPVNFSERYQGILRAALAIARNMPHGVDLLHVIRPGHGAEQEEREAAAAKKRLAALVPESMAERVEVHARVGDPVQEILRMAEEISPLSIVMGAHAKGMLKRFLFGTTTLSILHGAQCPVWFIPPGLSDDSGVLTLET